MLACVLSTVPPAPGSDTVKLANVTFELEKLSVEPAKVKVSVDPPLSPSRPSASELP